MSIFNRKKVVETVHLPAGNTRPLPEGSRDWFRVNLNLVIGYQAQGRIVDARSQRDVGLLEATVWLGHENLDPEDRAFVTAWVEGLMEVSLEGTP